MPTAARPAAAVADGPEFGGIAITLHATLLGTTLALAGDDQEAPRRSRETRNVSQKCNGTVKLTQPSRQAPVVRRVNIALPLLA
jgi:hypothetical protein